jgi:hypothetical protein
MRQTLLPFATILAIAAGAGGAAALTAAEMLTPEAQAVAAMLARQGIPAEVMQSLTMDQVRYVKTLLDAGDAASRAQAMNILGF